MSYKVVRNNGNVVAFGPNDHNYEPTLKQGDVLFIEQTLPPAPQKTTNELQAEARAQRNSLLTTSDWTQVIDSPVNQSAWATYRQALRDIPQQAGFPQTVVWPTQP